MLLKAQSVEKHEVLDLALLSIEAAARDGGMIAADEEAQRLLDSHPDCQLTFDELRQEIARLAVERKVGVEFGLRQHLA